MRLKGQFPTDRLRAFLLTLVVLAALLVEAAPQRVMAAPTLLPNRYDLINTSAASATAIHEFGLTMANTVTPVSSISFEFCSNTPIINDPCVPPAGFDASSTVLTAQSGEVGFSIHPSSTANRIVLTRPPLNPSGVSSTYHFIAITNPSGVGSYFVRLKTYSSSDATGPNIEEGGVVFAITSGLSVGAEVPPYLRFCAATTIVNFDCSTATSFFIDLGELRTTQINKASSQFVVATNAQSGYSISLNGTTLISGTNVIPAMAVQSPPTVGVSQFGINLKANTIPAIGAEVVGPGTSTASAGYNLANLYKFQAGDILTSVNHSDANRKYTVSYIVNVSSSQPAGVYSTTITYICLANF